MLTFVGLGLYDERSVTIQGRESIQVADRVFAEFYTSRLAGTTVEELEAFHGIEIEVRDRQGIEDDPGEILNTAETAPVAFLVGGDPMISTTHVDLRLRATERGIATNIVHGTTAQTAASSLTGLQNYRFGKSTTLPFPSTFGGVVPDSVIETIDENRGRNLHTLVYLDIDVEHGRYLSAGEAASALDARFGDDLVVAVARAGSDDPTMVADRCSTIAGRDIGDPLHLLIVPAGLHDLESEALRIFGGAPADLLALEN